MQDYTARCYEFIRSSHLYADQLWLPHSNADQYSWSPLVTQGLGAELPLQDWFSKMVQQTNKHTPLANLLYDRDDKPPFIYTGVAFLKNSEIAKAMHKLLCIFI